MFPSMHRFQHSFKIQTSLLFTGFKISRYIYVYVQISTELIKVVIIQHSYSICQIQYLSPGKGQRKPVPFLYQFL